jgi:hypothetical protein
MAASNIHETQKVYLEEGLAAIGAAEAFGLTDTVMGAITNPGTVDKLLTAIDGLALHETYNVRRPQITGAIDKLRDLGVLTDADVEAGRAASSARVAAMVAGLRALRQIDAPYPNRNFGLV